MTTSTENTSAVVALYDDVADYFNSAMVPPGTSVVFGWKERAKQINQGTGGANRVVFVPGKLDSGEDGAILGVEGPGERIVYATGGAIDHVEPRALFKQPKIVTVSVWASDGAGVTEADQVNTVEQLFEYVLRAVARSPVGKANATWQALRYNVKAQERRFGAEYLAELVLESHYLDAVPSVVIPTGAAVSRGHVSSVSP